MPEPVAEPPDPGPSPGTTVQMVIWYIVSVVAVVALLYHEIGTTGGGPIPPPETLLRPS